MKKALLILAILGFFTASTASALAYYKYATLDDYTVLQNAFTDADNIKVSMFKNASTTCYVLTSKGGDTRNPSSVAISCVK